MKDEPSPEVDTYTPYHAHVSSDVVVGEDFFVITAFPL